jgi:Carboxypeptidase regulatory-like domain
MILRYHLKSLLRITLSLVFLSLCLSTAFAQSDRGGITGKVTDNTGEILPGAVVKLTNDATGVVQKTTSNASGDYVFQFLNPGSYSLSTSAQGFKTVDRTHLMVDVGQANEQNVTLTVGSTTETVEVTTGVQQIQTESGSIGMIVEQKSIQELPLVYGNPFTLETLAPGILVSGVNPNIHAYDSSTATVSVNGSTLNSLEYRLDGAPDNRIRLSAYTPSTEFINQYKVETASYDATEGHSSGGFVNVSLKSGQNKFHGGAFASYQNPTLNSNYWHLGPTAAAKAVWLREGADLGGPIWRNKIFFFGGFEHSRAATPNVQSLTVPSLNERNGDLSELYSLGCANSTVNASGVGICPGGSVNPYQLYSPTSGVATTGGVCGSGKTCTVRQPIRGNVITNVNAIAASALKYYPAPNAAPNAAGGGNYQYSNAEPDYYYAYVARIDATLTPKQNIFGHWVGSHRLQPGKNSYLTTANGIASGTTLTYQNYGYAMGYTYAVTPATVLDAHLTWTRFVNQNVVSSQGTLNATSIGMPNYLVNGLGPNAQAFPRIDITGYQSLNSDNGVLSHDDVTLGSFQLSHLIKNHFLRAGVEYRMYNTNAGITTQSNGRYQNTGSYTTANSSTTAQQIGFGLAQFEYGIPTSSAITINTDLASRSNYMAEWLQDDWKATPTLTINIGLQFAYEGPNNERNQKANTYFDFGATNPASAAATAAYASIAPTNPLLLPASAFSVNGGLRFLGDPKTPFGGHQDYKAQTLNLLPRTGFSWEFSPNTVVRGGFGIFDDSLSTFYLSGGNSGSTSTFLLPQQGFTQSTSQNASNDTGVTFVSTLANPFPNGIAQPTGSSQGLSTFVGQAVTFQPSNPKTPYNIRWSLGLQHQFGAWLASADYVGNHGLHTPIQKEYDATPAQYLSKATNGYDTTTYANLNASVNNPYYNVLPNTVSLGSGKTTTVSQLLKPYSEFTGVSAYINSGNSSYSSLQTQLQRRFTNGASLTSAFTWSKTLDATQYLNTSDVNPWYGISANDRTFRFATSGIYEIPFGTGRRWLSNSGFISHVIGGWQVQGVYQVQSGQPLSFNPSTSTSPVYEGTGTPAGSAWGRGGFKTSSGNLTQTGNWFNTAQWATKAAPSGSTGVAVGTPGSYYYMNQYQVRTMPIRFDSLRADFMNQFDAAIQRNFSLSRLYESASLQFRADMINATNHPVYNTPSTDWTASTFGNITSQANQPRIYQFEAFVRF